MSKTAAAGAAPRGNGPETIVAQSAVTAGTVDAGNPPARDAGADGQPESTAREEIFGEEIFTTHVFRCCAGEQPESAAREPDAPQSKGFGWTLAPTRWSGTMATQMSMQNNGASRVFQQTESANFMAGSYIWQPWFAQVSGNLGLLTAQARANTGPGSANLRDDSTAVFGGGRLQLFPVSRFPFTASFDVSDSRATGEATNTQFTHTRIGLHQRYTPVGGGTNYAVGYDRSLLNSNQSPRDTLDVFSGSMSKIFDNQSFNLYGQHSRNQGSAGTQARASNLAAQHSYREGPSLSISSLASASLADNNATLTGDSSTRALQLNTFANWRPDLDKPLYMTGGVRVFQFASDNVGGAASESMSLGGNVGASYRMSPNTDLFASASATHVSANGTDDLFTSQSAGASYSADPIKLGSFNYNWNASGTASNQTSSVSGIVQAVSGGLGHSINRSIPLMGNSALGLFASQSVDAALDTRNAQSQSLTNTVGANWGFTPGTNSTAYLSLTGSDSRRSGVNEGQFQLVNFQANGQIQFNRHSSGSANLTMQGTNQSASNTPSTGFVFFSNGSLSYQHQRAFGVPRLRYTAQYDAYQTQYQSRALGDLNAPLEQVTQSFEQRLEYNIGRLDVRLTARVADIGGQRNSLIFIRMARQLGNF